MRKYIFALLVSSAPLVLFAQGIVGFKFGQVNDHDLDIPTYFADTSANAYVISEYGETHIAYDNPSKLIFNYHVKIKILRQGGLKYANVEVLLHKGVVGKEETISGIYASSFNHDLKGVRETKLDSKSIFREKNDEYYNFIKFAIPNASVGSVIEYQYEIHSFRVWNFREWEFQGELPKVISEYKTTIPAYYVYNTTLRGYLELTGHEMDKVRECFPVDDAIADCAIDKYVMKNIPAFKEEEYMTAKKNYLSAIRYELQQIKQPNGNIAKYTKEWKDVDLEYQNSANFGEQLKRGKNAIDKFVDEALLGEADPLARARKIFDLIKYQYTWNDYYGDQTYLGIKKAFEEKKGNVADINLTLIAALRHAGLNADPVLISTRDNGRPNELHPVASDFNYVIAKLEINGKTYLLDAIDDLMPFGSIPISCYNGIGRVMNSNGSFWMDISPTDRNRTAIMISLKLSDDGKMLGTVSRGYHGYAALRKRKQMADFQDEKDYVDQQKTLYNLFNIISYERTGEKDLSKPVIEKFGVEFSVFDPGNDSFLFNPFVAGRVETNPFKSDERRYPIDFAVPIESTISIYVDLPESVEAISIPDQVGIALPKNGGRYVFGAKLLGNKLTINDNFMIARPVFAPEEYPYLKEIYGKMVQAQGADVIFQKKKN